MWSTDMLEQINALGWPCRWLLAPLRALLGQPVLLAEFFGLASILVFSLGKPLGVPLQFFHESRMVQALAGFSSTLTAAHIFFVIYLVESSSREGLLEPLAAWFAVLWTSVVLASAVIREWSRRKPEAISPRFKLTPSLRSAYAEVSALAFFVGVLLGFGFVTVAALLLAPQLPWLDSLTGPTMASLGRPGEAHPGLHLVVLLLAGFVLAVLLTPRTRATPALAFCSLLVLVATAIGASNYWLEASTSVVLIVICLATWVGREHYAIRVPDLKAFYGAGAAQYPPSVAPSRAEALGAEPLLADALITRAANPPNLRPLSRFPDKRPLVLICTSGGGVRAAVWTAGLLGRLGERVAELPHLALMVTGASGGMVGASYWLANLRHAQLGGTAKSWQELASAVSQESLTTITRTLVLNDVPRSLLSRVNAADRGLRMQDAWQTLATQALDIKVPFGALRQGELAQDWPSLVFSPMVVEDGRRLLLGNPRLAAVTESESLWVEDIPRPNSPGHSSRARLPASHNAFHAADLFDPATADSITLATAARLSASFPYISPAVVLPTKPRTRAVDAGYYDNYGIDLATGWLREALEHHADWLEANISSILLIQIRDDTSPLSEGREGRPKPLRAQQGGVLSALARGLEGLTTPVQGFIAARASVMQLRNDSQLDTIARAYEARFRREFIAHELFELKGDVSLSWYLAEFEVSEILKQLEAVGDKVTKVADWLSP